MLSQGLDVWSGTGCGADFAPPPGLEKLPIIHCRTGQFVGNGVMWLCTPSAGSTLQGVSPKPGSLSSEDPKGSPGYLSMS